MLVVSGIACLSMGVAIRCGDSGSRRDQDWLHRAGNKHPSPRDRQPKGVFRAEGLDVLNITMRANIAVNALLTRGIDYATPSTSIVKAATSGLGYLRYENFPPNQSNLVDNMFQPSTEDSSGSTSAFILLISSP